MRLVFLFCLLVTTAFAQKETNNWYFGVYAGVTFNSGAPVVLGNGDLRTDEGCSSISDANGQLLFYSDGVEVWDRNHQVMPNGSGLLGHESATQSCIIVPKPGSSTEYYVFTVGVTSFMPGLRYSIVDMSLNGGFGAVTTKNVLLNSLACEKLTGIKKAANEYWILTRGGFGSNSFYAYTVDITGVNTTPVTSYSGMIMNPGDVAKSSIGNMKISPNGDKILTAGKINGLELFDFNINTGVVSNPLTISTGYAEYYGVEFSPSGKYGYASYREEIAPGFNTIHVIQFDLFALDILSTIVTIANPQNYVPGIQLASDNKLYLTTYPFAYLDVINFPENQGAACGYQIHGVNLDYPGSTSLLDSGLNLPQFLPSYFSTFIVENFCLGQTTNFSLLNTTDVTNVDWDFGDGNTANGFTTSHVYNTTGTYTVTAQITKSGIVQTKTKEIIISEIPLATQPSNILVCDTDNNGYFNFDLTQNEGAILNGQLTTDFGVNYYANMVDYMSKVKISNPASYQNTSLAYQPQIIVAEVYNKNNSSCNAITNFDIQVFESPMPTTTILPITTCDNTSFGTDSDGRIIFDLTQRENDILNGQSSSVFTVEYFTDSALTNLITTPNSYINTASTETIYVKVFNTQNPSCEATTSFQIEVFSLPVVNSPVILKQCDDDNDGYSTFNLTEAIELISNDSTLTFSFFETPTLANAGTSPITNIMSYTNQTVSNDTIYVRVENTNGCYRVVTLNLVVSTTLISSAIQEHIYACDDTASGSNTDGIATFDFSSVDAIINSQYPAGQLLTITYYESLVDALAEQNAIIDIANFTNSNSPNIQNIYVRVDSQLNNECLGLGHHVTLHVETIPIVQPLQYTHCDDDQDGYFAFDTTNLESDLLNGLNNVTVSYFDAVGNPVSMTNPFNTISQIVTVRVTNNTPTACYYETTLTFTVDDLPEAFSIPNNLIKVCDDETVPNLQDGIFAFDTSNFQNIILGSQAGMIVNYYDENGNLLPSPLPSPFVTATQDVLVEVINPTNNNCFATKTIAFEVYPLPYIDLYGTELICSNDPSFVRIINAGLEDETLQNNYTYNWYFNGSLIAGENNYELTVNTDGIYTVDVISSDGCVMTRTIQVTASNIATIQNIEIVELSNNNSIIIEVTGSGDFEYSLDNITYQDSNSFYNVEPGIYTVYIRDKNGCGVVNEDVSILGIPNFFTPNGDGYNDTWNIKGANVTFNSKTIIYIFDRYGKLLKQISPLGKGWDGTYNGELMPSSDYWYSVELENGKILKGHFSLKR